MTNYTYIPFPSDSLHNDTSLAANMENVIYSNLTVWDNGSFTLRTHQGHFIKKGFFGKGKRGLSVVGAGDTLWVSAHGVGDDAPICASQVAATMTNPASPGTGIDAGLPVTWLARRIAKDGLRKDFRDLRLSICYSGLAKGSSFSRHTTTAVNPRAAVGADCLASLLARELGALGYRSIVVRGATGEVAGKKVVVAWVRGSAPIKDDYETASRRFDSSGRRVSVTTS